MTTLLNGGINADVSQVEPWRCDNCAEVKAGANAVLGAGGPNIAESSMAAFQRFDPRRYSRLYEPQIKAFIPDFTVACSKNFNVMPPCDNCAQQPLSTLRPSTTARPLTIEVFGRFGM